MNKLLTMLSCTTMLAHAHVFALEAISDRELSDVSGQAFITVDTSSYSDPTYGNFEFSKINLGVDIEIQANADSVKLGTFERAYGSEGTAPLIDVTFPNGYDSRTVTFRDANNDGIVDVNDSDLQLDNLALGRVDNYLTDNPVIVPFQVHNPYIELAYALDGNGVRRIAGVRIGAESAFGDLSADLISLTGTFDGLVVGSTRVAYEDACDNWWQSFECTALAVAGDRQMYSNLGLMDGTDGEPVPADSDGVVRALYVKRTQWAGIRNGDFFTTQDPDDNLRGILEALAVADNCYANGVLTCFNVGVYDSIYVGVDDANDADDNFEDNGARGVFVSLQSEVVPWEDLSGLPDADRVYTEHGAYLNSAKYMAGDGNERYPLVLDLYEGLSGTQRVATCVGRTKGC